MICAECQRLEDAIRLLGLYNRDAKHLEQELVAHDELSNSLITLVERKIMKARVKTKPDSEEIDLVICSDAAGSSGFIRLVHYVFM